MSLDPRLVTHKFGDIKIRVISYHKQTHLTKEWFVVNRDQYSILLCIQPRFQLHR